MNFLICHLKLLKSFLFSFIRSFFHFLSWPTEAFQKLRDKNFYASVNEFNRHFTVSLFLYFHNDEMKLVRFSSLDCFNCFGVCKKTMETSMCERLMSLQNCKVVGFSTTTNAWLDCSAILMKFKVVDKKLQLNSILYINNLTTWWWETDK